MKVKRVGVDLIWSAFTSYPRPSLHEFGRLEALKRAAGITFMTEAYGLCLNSVRRQPMKLSFGPNDRCINPL